MEENPVIGDLNKLIRNHLISDVLFNYLPIEDLNNSRLVCKLWDGKICEILRKSATTHLKSIELFKFEKFEEFQSDMENAQEKRIFTQFYSLLENFISFGQIFFDQHEPKLLSVNLCNGPAPDYDDFEVGPISIPDLLTVLRWSSNSVKELTLKGLNCCEIFKFPARAEHEDLLDFNLPHLEKITLEIDWNEWWMVQNQVDLMGYKLFSEILKKAPNLKFLTLSKASATKPCRFIENLKKSEILSTIQEFSILYEHCEEVVDINNYDDPDGTQRIGPKDLIEMQQENGLQNLKSFELQLNFHQYKKAKLGPDFDLLSRFLQGLNRSKLLSLGLNIGVDNESGIDSGVKIIFPIFPKLVKLYLGNENRIVDMENISYFPFAIIDLQDQLPCLNEITLNLRFGQDFKFSTWNTMFAGQSPTVQIVRLKILSNFDFNPKLEPYPSFLALENLFPNVKKFELDDDFEFCKRSSEGKKPWENSLKILSIFYYTLEEVDFNFFLPFNALERIEFTNSLHNFKTYTLSHVDKLNLEHFEKLTIKSLKIHHFSVSEEIVKQIQAHCILDYSSEKPAFEYSYSPPDDE